MPRPIIARHLAHLVLFAGLAGALVLTGCKSNNQPAPIVNGSADSGDPGDGNLAPVSGNTSSQPTQVLGQSSSYQPQQQSENYAPQQQAAPVQQDYNNTQYDNAGEAAIQTTQPPPPLPDYDQPPDPDPNYIWTPGYWNYASSGYYWVPGAWCPPPYYGALWTPPYWGYYGGHYGFHRGYWGPHIGFYGGINYGFGYIGIGYFGGYWRGHDFYYNRAVNNINVTNIHNVYNRTVVYDNHTYGARPDNHVSYNGGRGGIDARPSPAELAAAHEYHAPPVQAQVQARTMAQQNRGQFYDQNHGKPAQTAFERPVVQNARIAEPPAAAAAQIQRGQQLQQRNTEQQQHSTGQQRPAPQPEQQRNAQTQQEQRNTQLPNQQRTSQPQQEQRAPQQRQPEQRQPEQPRPTAQPRPTPQPQRAEPTPQARPQEQARPQQPPRPQQQARPQEAPRAQPAPAPRAEPAARPAPAPRPAAPASHAEAPHEESHPR